MDQVTNKISSEPSSVQCYKVVYAGAIVDGFDEASVRKAFEEKLNIPSNKVARYFSGKPIVLKKGISKQKSESLKNKLESIGAEAVVLADLQQELESHIRNTQQSDKSPMTVSTFARTEAKTESHNQKQIQSQQSNTHESDEELELAVKKARALMLEQQLQSQLEQKESKSPYRKLVAFSVFLIATMLLLLFWIDDIG